MKTPRRVILAATSDLHANSKTALAPPTFVLDDQDTFKASPIQRFTWNWWQSYWDFVERLHMETRWPVYFLINGETGDDLSHASSQIITKNMSDILRMVEVVIQRGVNLAEKVVITRGTQAHSGLNSHIDEMVARDLHNIYPDERRGTASWWQFSGKIGGVRTYAQHHAPKSYSEDYLAISAAVRNANEMLRRFSKQGRDPAQVCLFGHTHKPFDSGDYYSMIRTINTPSWQLTNAFGHKLSGKPLDIGGSVIMCDDGKFTVHHHWTNHLKEDKSEQRWQNV